MGQPVVHFEIGGTDGPKLREYYSELFGWAFDTSAPMDYGTVDRAANLSSEGIGGGVGTGRPSGRRRQADPVRRVPRAETCCRSYCATR